MKPVPVLNNRETEPAIYTRDQHNISRQNIDEDALKIMYRLIRNGYKAFLVGGGVRDLLLSKKPKDFDIGTDATPRRIKSLFRNSRIIGRRFKLVHVYFRGNKIIEVSTFRDENEVPEESGNLKTDNVYGHEATDALRRDITINGLFYDLANFSVIDYVGGMHDLQDGIIRVIGDPDTRFKDDPVRLLRVIRHAARNGFKINKECWESLVKNKGLISHSSAVRVYEEVKKDFVSGHFLEILKLLAKSGLLDHIWPLLGEKAAALLKPESVFHRTIERIDHLVRQKKSVSATAFLSVMALVLLNADEEVVLPERGAEEVIKDFVANIYSVLSVPRKEKERIVHIMSIFRELSLNASKRIKLASLSRKPFFKDLLMVAYILEGSLISPEVIKILEDAEKHGKKEHAEHSTDRPQRMHNRMRRRK